MKRQYHFPIAFTGSANTTRRYVTIACAFLSVVVIVWQYALEFPDALQLAFIIVTASMLPLSVRFPVAAASVFLCVTVAADAFGSATGTAILLGFPILGVISAQRSVWFALAYAVLFWFIGFYSFEEHHFYFDPYTATVATVLMLIAFLCGWWIRHELARRYVARSWVDTKQNELTVLAHNTIASELTSLVVRLEALGLRRPELRDELEPCAETARQTIEDVRALIEALQAPESPNQRPTFPDPLGSLRAADLSLRWHGFETSCNFKLPQFTYTDDVCQVVGECASEIVTNILKYGDPETPVAIHAEASDNEMQLTFTNAISEIQTTENSLRLGLRYLHGLCASIDGKLDYRASEAGWSVHITLPLLQENTTQRESATGFLNHRNRHRGDRYK